MNNITYNNYDVFWNEPRNEKKLNIVMSIFNKVSVTKSNDVLLLYGCNVNC